VEKIERTQKIEVSPLPNRGKNKHKKHNNFEMRGKLERPELQSQKMKNPGKKKKKKGLKINEKSSTKKRRK
jgi:hypothetical protein